jgi:hypothetical protein
MRRVAVYAFDTGFERLLSSSFDDVATHLTRQLTPARSGQQQQQA